MGENKSDKLKFSFIQLTFWCSWCAFTSFAALFLKKKGLSQAQIGLALSISTLGGILGQFIWGFLCDKLKTIKKNFIAANLLMWISILAFLFLGGPVWVFILMFILGFAQIPQPSVLDTWILKKLPGREEEYGKIRLWASVGFALFALGFGWAIEFFGYQVIFITASFFIVLTLFVSFRVSDAKEKENRHESLKESFRALFKNKRYFFFIMVCFIIGLAYRTVHLLLPLIIDHVKGGAFELGLAYFFGVAAEIPMLLASKKLSTRFKSNTLILFSDILYMVQFAILIIATSPFLVMAAMVAQGLAFGNYLPSIRLFVYESAPESLRTSAQTLADAIVSSLTAVIGSAAGGLIIQNYGVKTVLIIGMGLLASAFVILLIDILRNKYQKNLN